MSFSDLMGLLGGLALFLYGMQMMSSGLETAAGNKLKMILEKLTANRFVGVLVGAVITAIIQSSSATTVMVVGFVNSRMMTLQQAVWIIMGANIGTTITGQLIALDVSAIAPLIAFIGVAAVVFVKNEKIHYFGEVFAGLGILFVGMDMMSSAMKPLADVPEFVNLLTSFESPVLGILAGMIFTALIQSSSASVGILQALAASNVIGLNSAAYVLFGQNIGTCVTALLASVGSSKNAKRTTLIHIMFNVIGTVIFTVLCQITPLISLVQGFTPENVPAQIANLHTLFNIVTTVVLIPFGYKLAKLTTVILKDDENEKQESSVPVNYLPDLSHINFEKMGAYIICSESIKNEHKRMLGMAKENVAMAFEIFATGDEERLCEVEKNEEYIDYLNKEISKYITSVAAHDSTSTGSQVFNSLFSITGNIERIGDHATNIAEYAGLIKEKGIKFSDRAQTEITELKQISKKLFDALESNYTDVVEWHGKIAAMEQKIDDVTILFRNNMFARIQEGSCSDEGSILFSEMLTDFERIGDHALNISEEMVKIAILDN